MSTSDIINYSADNGSVDIVEFDDASSTVKVSIVTSMISEGQVTVPGGKTGQVYTKLSDEDFDVGWVDNLADGVEGIRGEAEAEYSQGYYTITPSKIGLGNVDNTSDLDKPISTATKAELDLLQGILTEAGQTLEEEIERTSEHINNYSNPHNVTKTQLGLGNVTNDAQVKRTELGVPNGVAQLDENSKVVSSQLPDYLFGQLVYGGNVKGSVPPQPISEIEVGDVLSNLYFNTYIKPDLSQLDWSHSTFVSDKAQHVLHIIGSVNGVDVVRYASHTVVNGVELEGDAYFISVQDRICFATSNMAKLFDDRSGWFVHSVKFAPELEVDLVSQQDSWGSYISKESVWESSEGIVTATLSLDAQGKLGTVLTTIVLSDDNAVLTGYVANYGLYYPAVNNFVFAGLDFKTGDWLISNGREWAKIDNTDAVSGVKGQEESIYRTGLVNITQANIGIYKYRDVDAVFMPCDEDSQFPYCAAIKLPELIRSDQVADVYFSKDQVLSSDYAPYCETADIVSKTGPAVNKIEVNDLVTRLYFNTSVVPNPQDLDWSDAYLVEDNNYQIGLATKELSRVEPEFSFITWARITKDAYGTSSDIYALIIFSNDIVYVACDKQDEDKIRTLTEVEPNTWLYTTLEDRNTENHDMPVEYTQQQDLWKTYVSKDGQWADVPEGFGLKVYSKSDSAITIPMIVIK